jgi:predicted RNase H-like HicB family nuclease
MRTYTAVIERCPDTDLYVGYVPGFPGAHSQAESLDELHSNLEEVIAMLLEDGDPKPECRVRRHSKVYRPLTNGKDPEAARGGGRASARARL